MTSKIINYIQLEKAVRAAYNGDNKMTEMYDRKVNVHGIDDIVADVLKKIKEFDNSVYYGVYFKENPIGYFVIEPTKLISFALSPAYRKRSILRQFFSSMRDKLGKEFVCLLWSRNIRAVKWLCKNGMKIYDTNPMITTLVY